jgi:hypothetical protein
MANRTYNDFLKDPDQASRRAELETFFGPNAAKFMKTYDSQRALVPPVAGEKAKFSFKFSYVWPAFFVGPVWFFYRKMWTVGVVLTAVIIAVGFLPFGTKLGLILGLIMAAFGSLTYLTHAVKTIERLRSASPNGVLDPREVAAAGGVSKIAGWIGGTIYVLVTLLAIYGMVILVRTGGAGPY